MDPTDLSPNFINPAYATPEQVALLRRYAEQLLTPPKPADIAPHWTGALAASLKGMMGPLVAQQATGLQQAGLQSAAQQDPNLRMLQARQLLGQTAPTSVPGQSAQPMSFSGTPDIKAATLMQESGNNPNIGPSVSGAIGPGQIMPETFKQFARPGEDITNPQANRDVSGRILDTYMSQYGDPARAAVAYFSGPGNVAPPGSPTPWKRDIADPNGKTVSSYVSDVIGRMGGRQQVAQAGPLSSYSAYQHNPWANPKEQDLARGMVTPTPSTDVYGQPVIGSIYGGVQAQPVGPGVIPGYRAPVTVGAEGQVSTEIPFPAQGGTAQSAQERLQPIVTMGQQFGQQAAANKALRGGVEGDVQAAQAAFPIMQNLDLMANEIDKHGTNMTFGPSAELITNLKKVVAQHAPSLMSASEIEGLAAQDNVRKMTALLSTAIGRQTGNTDLSLMQGRESVPGEHNSKEGAKAIIDMLKQQIGLNARFVMENYRNYGQPGFNPLIAKSEFYRKNPIINPLTQNPITVDLAKGEKVAPSQNKLSDEELKKRLGIQ